jgi:DNA polymerase I-like protein with 3'-5' exonuclease and polymerase domains
MVEIYKFLRANGYKTKMILQVHDSLLQQVWEPEIQEGILGYLRWLQTERKLFRVTVQVDVGICVPTWRDKKDIEVPCIEPPADQLEKMNNYDIWMDGILD